jgi:uncharacterized protein YbbK (DUF523 family)
MTKLAHDPGAVERLRAPTAQDPWRVLLSGCLAGWACGVEGTDYGLGAVLRPLLSLPGVRVFPFCPERHTLGVPRPMPDIHGGDGFAVLDGRARVLAPDGADLTEAMVEGAREMLRVAQQASVELAILTDMSAACGSQVISDGCRLVADRRWQLGVGVAAALLLRAGIPVVSQRDFLTLGRLRARLEPGWVPPEEARDHHDHPWVIANLRS